MDRHEWKLAYRELRVMARDSKAISIRANGPRVAQGWHAIRLQHGGTYWTVKFVAAYGDDRGLHAYPSIIRDRATWARHAAEMNWTAQFRAKALRFRYRGEYAAHERGRAIIAAKSCIADARAIRLAGSAFHAIAA